LTNEKEYKAYGEKVGSVLYQGSFPVRIESFYKDLSKDLPQYCDSKQIRKIADNLQSLYYTKLAEEKKAIQGKKKPQKSQIKGGGAKGYDAAKSNNMAMVANVMGAD
jgi:hypothetical protein